MQVVERVRVLGRDADLPAVVDASAVVYPELLLMPNICKAPELLSIWRQHLEQVVLATRCRAYAVSVHLHVVFGLCNDRRVRRHG